MAEITKKEEQATQAEEPKGIGFFNIKTGDTYYAKTEAIIQGFINSSDMGINASKDQDFGWRIHPEWVKAVRSYRANPTKMEALTNRHNGQTPSEVNILYAIYGEQLRQYEQQLIEHDNPYEEEYLAKISKK